MSNAVINGTGNYLPERNVTNHELTDKLDTSHDWIISRTGISSRHVASEAAKRALESPSVQADDIDLILVATCTPN